MRSSGPGSFLEEAAACRRDFVLVSVGGLTRRSASALVGVLLASRLGPSSFGILSLAIAISLVLVPLGDLGLRTIGWLETARATGRRGVTTSVLLAKLLLGLSVSVATLALALLLPLDDRLRVALIICAFQPLFNSEALDWLFRARGQHLLVAVSDLLAAGFQVSLVFWLVRQPGDITVAALGWIGGNVVAFLLLAGFSVAQGQLARFDATELRYASRSMRKMAHLAVPALLTRVQIFAPVLLIGFLADKATVGQFRLSHLIVTLAASLAVFLTNTTFTHVANIFPADPGAAMVRLRAAIRTINSLMIPLTVLGTLAGADLLRFLLPAYGEAARYAPFLFAGMLVITHATYLRQMLPTIGLMRSSTRAYLLPLVIFASVSLLLARGGGWSALSSVVTGLLLSEAASYLHTRWLVRNGIGGVYFLEQQGEILLLVFLIILAALDSSLSPLIKVVLGVGICSAWIAWDQPLWRPKVEAER